MAVSSPPGRCRQAPGAASARPDRPAPALSAVPPRVPGQPGPVAFTGARPAVRDDLAPGRAREPRSRLQEAWSRALDAEHEAGLALGDGVDGQGSVPFASTLSGSCCAERHAEPRRRGPSDNRHSGHLVLAREQRDRLERPRVADAGKDEFGPEQRQEPVGFAVPAAPVPGRGPAGMPVSGHPGSRLRRRASEGRARGRCSPVRPARAEAEVPVCPGSAQRPGRRRRSRRPLSLRASS